MSMGHPGHGHGQQEGGTDAQWIDPPAPGQPLRLRLGRGDEPIQAALERALESRRLLHPQAPAGRLELDTGGRRIGASGLAALRQRLASAGFTLEPLVSADPATRVAAAALGIGWLAPGCDGPETGPTGETTGEGSDPADALSLHRGTLRSGDQLAVRGSLLVLGDVNPGARVQAGGHVLVWGRLRGVAHAGCRGDTQARIVALQLRPLQLRIADVVARGPDEPPPPGLAEEARLVDGAIRIDAASPIWPLSG